MSRIFSGIQPTGTIHIGNYLGALRQFVRLQDTASDCLYCIVDMHAITAARIEREQLRHHSRLLAAAYMACGLDPQKSIIFVQSAVGYHARLTWILSCVARIGWLARMTQFKDKAGKDAQHASVGLYTYPILMAADILLYQTNHVPVGEDQKQHIELARDIAQKFNHDFAPLFTIPEPMILTDTRRINSLRDGTKKMSKSDPSPASYISLADDDASIAEKIRKAKTDALPFPQVGEDLATRPEVRNLLTIAAALTDTSVEDVITQFSGASFSAFKEALIAQLIAHIAPIRARITDMMQTPDQLDALLAEGAQRAAALAQPFYAQVADCVGFVHG